MRTLKKAYLEITNQCDLSCVFCPGTQRPKGMLSPERFLLMAQKLRPHTRHLYLHLMGEPLIHPQLGQLLEIAHRLDFRVTITTNGTHLAQRSHLLRESPAVYKVSISLHSFEGNEGAGPLTDYLDHCLAFARQAALSGKLCALRLWNLDGDALPGANLRNDEILARIEEAFPRPWTVGRRGTTLSPGIFLEWGARFQWPDLSAPDLGPSGFCFGLRDQVGVLWDGTVVPCCLDHEGDLPLGNLYRQSLEEILCSPRAQEIYDGFSRRQATQALCRRCGYARRFQP